MFFKIVIKITLNSFGQFHQASVLNRNDQMNMEIDRQTKRMNKKIK